MGPTDLLNSLPSSLVPIFRKDSDVLWVFASGQMNKLVFLDTDPMWGAETIKYQQGLAWKSYYCFSSLSSWGCIRKNSSTSKITQSMYLRFHMLKALLSKIYLLVRKQHWQSLAALFLLWILILGYIFIDLEREVGREREIDVRNIDWVPPAWALTQDGIHNLCLCPVQESKPSTFWCIG